jgi:hypothetical protein
MISCRPHYLPKEFSSIIFVAFYLTPQNEAGTKTALKQLYKAISKEENAHPEAALLVAGNLNQFYQIFTSMSHVQPESNKILDHLHSTHRDALPVHTRLRGQK